MPYPASSPSASLAEPTRGAVPSTVSNQVALVQPPSASVAEPSVVFKDRNESECMITVHVVGALTTSRNGENDAPDSAYVVALTSTKSHASPGSADVAHAHFYENTAVYCPLALLTQRFP